MLHPRSFRATTDPVLVTAKSGLALRGTPSVSFEERLSGQRVDRLVSMAHSEFLILDGGVVSLDHGKVETSTELSAHRSSTGSRYRWPAV